MALSALVGALVWCSCSRLLLPIEAMTAHFLLIFLLVVLISGGVAENPACRLAASTLPRFKYETFYGWHPSNGNFTNVGQSPEAKGLQEFHTETGKPGIMELESVFFTGATKPLRGMVMKRGGAAAWKALAQTIKPLVDKKIIIGFMLGGE